MYKKKLQYNRKFQGGFSLNNFYEKMKVLKPLVLTDGECKKIYFKQIFKPRSDF